MTTTHRTTPSSPTTDRTTPSSPTTHRATASSHTAIRSAASSRTDTAHTGSRTATARQTEIVLAAFRVVVAFLFGCHALVGFGLLGGIDGQGTAVEFASWPGWWASIIQLIGAILLLTATWTRPTALILSGVMAYAYFTVHQATALLPLHNLGEPAALYSWIFLLLAATGPGHFRR